MREARNLIRCHFSDVRTRQPNFIYPTQVFLGVGIFFPPVYFKESLEKFRHFSTHEIMGVKQVVLQTIQLKMVATYSQMMIA